MGFTKSLAKGFVRSMVNQVGRDGGKVISNELYGDAHSTPYRNVSTERVQQDTRADTTIEIKTATSTGKAVFFVLVGLLFNIIGAIALIICGYMKIKNAGISKAYEHQTQAIYKQDGRYKQGSKFIGSRIVKAQTTVQASQEDYEQNLLVGKIYLYGGTIILLLAVAITALK